MRISWVACCLCLFVSAACGGSGSSHGAASSWPIVTSRDGALLSPMNLVTIVSETDAADAPTLFQFSSGLGASRWWKTLAAEYGLGAVNAAANLLGPPITADMTDHDVYAYIQAAVAAHEGPPRDGNSLYLLYLPAGVALVRKGVRNTGCQKFGAYHARLGVLGDNLAVVQQCTTTDPLALMTTGASHEIIEAATDPDGQSYVLPPIAPHAPWNQPIWNAYDLNGRAELGDLCEGTYIWEGDFVYQRVWSNAHAEKGGDPCIPQIADPYYAALFESDWYPVSAGQTVSIRMRGWSTGAVGGAWPVSVHVSSAVDGFTASAGGDGTLAAQQTAVVTVTAPAAAPPGTFALVTAASERPPGTSLLDGAHLTYVGVYVP